jgi:hypothetical protein
MSLIGAGSRGPLQLGLVHQLLREEKERSRLEIGSLFDVLKAGQNDGFQVAKHQYAESLDWLSQQYDIVLVKSRRGQAYTNTTDDPWVSKITS